MGQQPTTLLSFMCIMMINSSGIGSNGSLSGSMVSIATTSSSTNSCTSKCPKKGGKGDKKTAYKQVLQTIHDSLHPFDKKSKDKHSGSSAASTISQTSGIGSMYSSMNTGIDSVLNQAAIKLHSEESLIQHATDGYGRLNRKTCSERDVASTGMLRSSLALDSSAISTRSESPRLSEYQINRRFSPNIFNDRHPPPPHRRSNITPPPPHRRGNITPPSPHQFMHSSSSKVYNKRLSPVIQHAQSLPVTATSTGINRQVQSCTPVNINSKLKSPPPYSNQPTSPSSHLPLCNNRQSPSQQQDYRKSPSSGIYSGATSLTSSSPTLITNSSRPAVIQAWSARQAKTPHPIVQSVKSNHVQKPVLQTAIAPEMPQKSQLSTTKLVAQSCTYLASQPTPLYNRAQSTSKLTSPSLLLSKPPVPPTYNVAQSIQKPPAPPPCNKPQSIQKPAAPPPYDVTQTKLPAPKPYYESQILTPASSSSSIPQQQFSFNKNSPPPPLPPPPPPPYNSSQCSPRKLPPPPYEYDNAIPTYVEKIDRWTKGSSPSWFTNDPKLSSQQFSNLFSRPNSIEEEGGSIICFDSESDSDSSVKKIRHASPIPDRKKFNFGSDDDRNLDSGPMLNYTPQAFKFFMEQHMENLLKAVSQRNYRRIQLEDELTRIDLHPEVAAHMRELLAQKESNHIRLRRAKMNTSMFEKITTIGVGAFGEVSLVRKIDSNTLYAMKMLKKTDVLDRNQMAHVKAERDILAESDNEWVVKLYFSFQDENFLYLVMDYIPGGDLMALLIKFGVFEEPLACFYVAELTCAVESVHKMGFIHRDIKPDNILIDGNGHLKLTDFGLCTGFRWTHDSKYYQKKDHERQESIDPIDNQIKDCDSTQLKLLERRKKREGVRSHAHSLVGTPNYIAPEVLKRSGYTQLCDWWSVGVIMYEMLIGSPPFLANTPAETQYNIINWDRTLLIPRSTNISYESRDLIMKLLVNAERRLGRNVQEIKSHPFFRSIDFTKSLRKQRSPHIPRIQGEYDVSNFDPVDPDHLCFSEVSRSRHTNHSSASDVRGRFHGFFEFTFRRFFDEKCHDDDFPLDTMASKGSLANEAIFV